MDLSLLLIFVFCAAGGGGLFLLRRERRRSRTLERQVRELNEKFQSVLTHFEEERSRLETTFSGMTEGVLLTDQRGEIIHLNPAFKEMFELEGKVEGRSALEVLASVACDDAIQKVIQEGKPVEKEVVFGKPKPRVFQIHFSPMRRDGKLFGVVSVFHDLTEIRRLEEVRRDLIANLSHELTTPLTAIRGFSETLLDHFSEDPAMTQKYLEVIFRHSAELSHLMENLLNLSRIESGKEEVLLKEVALKPFVDHLFERFSAQAAVKKINLFNEIPDEAPALRADPAKLNQIFGNLLDNAVKYTPEGGKVWVRGRVEIGDGSIFLIEVADNGPGIPAADQARIFERFYRVDKARSRDSGGAGLGLAIVKHLVELHGGRVTVESSPGRGSKFKLTFPSSR